MDSKNGGLIMKQCIITFRSQTAATKASRFIKRSGSKAGVVGVDPSVSSHGCGWGVSVDCSEIEDIKKKLNNKWIAYGEVLSGGI